MLAIKAILRFTTAFFLLLGLMFWLWLTSASVNGWQTWLFRAGHKIAYVQDEDAGSRIVAFVLRPHEDVTYAVKSCIHSFDKMLLQDGTFVHCVAYGSVNDAELSKANPQLVCETGRAIQMPYGTATNAEILINHGERCGEQPNYLPQYVRDYTNKTKQI
ncbi:hypothetical protein [Deinococcus sp.]|uniref:hypothetical protein n=1 Tax=Deinococcus sp. TaxID=47478 RepID=UPI0025C46663|nr:hypothetical protein [Deinococcus sp.]